MAKKRDNLNIMKFLKIIMTKKQIILMFSLFLTLYDVAIANNIKVRKETILKGRYGSADDMVGYYSDHSSWQLPTAIAVDIKGNIYIADVVNNRIQKFDKNGRFISKIKFMVKEKQYGGIISDLAIDSYDNLYVASRHELKIDKYSPDGKFLQSINLDDKDICWDEKNAWHRCSIQIEGLVIDVIGNIYLKGWREIIKFNSNGKIEKKWAPIEYGRTSVLDEKGNLYLLKEGNVLEKYNQKALLVDSGKCGELYSWLEDRHCFLPKFIDKNGFLYRFEKNGTTIVRMNKEGKQDGVYNIPDLPPVDIDGNNIEFDANGNLYILYFKAGFWVEKIVFQ